MLLVVIGKDGKACDEWVADHLASYSDSPHSILMRGNFNGVSLSSLGNEFLTMAKAKGETVFGMAHADTHFGPEALDKFAEVAMAGSVCGIVGRDPGLGNRWCCNKVEKPGPIASLLPGPVGQLDDCSVFFRVDLGLSFDEATFNGFHCHVRDLCLQAEEKGIPRVVPVADASHRGDSTTYPQWRLQWNIYDERLKKKWAKSGFKVEST